MNRDRNHSTSQLFRGGGTFWQPLPTDSSCGGVVPFVVRSFDNATGEIVLEITSDALALNSASLIGLIVEQFNRHAELLLHGQATAAERVADDLQRSIIDQMTENGEVPPAVRRALNRARVNQRLLERTAMVSQAQAAALLGKNPQHAAVVLGRLENAGKIFRVKSGGGIRYPLFQFDVDQCEPHPVVARLLATAPSSMTGLELLRFFMQTNAELSDIEVGIERAPPDTYPAALIG